MWSYRSTPFSIEIQRAKIYLHYFFSIPLKRKATALNGTFRYFKCGLHILNPISWCEDWLIKTTFMWRYLYKSDHFIVRTFWDKTQLCWMHNHWFKLIFLNKHHAIQSVMIVDFKTAVLHTIMILKMKLVLTKWPKTKNLLRSLFQCSLVLQLILKWV